MGGQNNYLRIKNNYHIAECIAGLKGGAGVNVPLHISRFFPRYKMQDAKATDVELVYRLAETAKEYLKYVYTGNC